VEKLILFGLLSIPVIVISWKPLFNIKSHGFYRFFSWECILWLIVSNYKFWFENPFCVKQIFSWLILLFALYLLFIGVKQFMKTGKPKAVRDDKTLYSFEKTTELVDTGIYKYIRHPMYSSLLFLTWGIYLKNTSIELLIVSLLSSIFLYLTAKFDEIECEKYFGEKYKAYIKRSKMFIPFLF
jgi:protein-S-isoprenylcysteine O-methyltransferase Ste14